MPVLTLVLVLAAAASKVPPEVLEKMEPAFAGTLVSTYDDGRRGHLNLSRDGTYRYRGRKNDPSSGVWDVKGQTVCLHQRRPIPIGSYCTPLPNGTSWRTKAAGGEMVTVRVVRGAG